MFQILLTSRKNLISSKIFVNSFKKYLFFFLEKMANKMAERKWRISFICIEYTNIEILIEFLNTFMRTHFNILFSML